MNEKRKPGFYWVKISSEYSDPETPNWRWVICEFDGTYWYYQGCRYEDKNFLQIDEFRLERIIKEDNKIKLLPR
jgi:hypothetical protein